MYYVSTHRIERGVVIPGVVVDDGDAEDGLRGSKQGKEGQTMIDD